MGARSVCLSPCGVRSQRTDRAAGKRSPTAALLRSDEGGAERIEAGGAVVVTDGSAGGSRRSEGGAWGKNELTDTATAISREKKSFIQALYRHFRDLLSRRVRTEGREPARS